MPSCTGWMIWRTHWRNVWFISNKVRKSSLTIPGRSSGITWAETVHSEKPHSTFRAFSWAQVCLIRNGPFSSSYPGTALSSPYLSIQVEKSSNGPSSASISNIASRVPPPAAGCLWSLDYAPFSLNCEQWGWPVSALAGSTLQLLVMKRLSCKDSPVRAFAINHSILGLRVKAAFHN